METIKPKYKIGEWVAFSSGDFPFQILEIALHGGFKCRCCTGDLYFLYRLNNNLWVNENRLVKVLVN